jgi:hypothetical protein
MKKHFLTLVLLFGMVISYAGNNGAVFAAAEDGLSQETTQWVGTTTVKTGETFIHQMAPLAEIVVSCKLQFKGTIDGKEVNMTIIVDGISCQELLKALVKAL